jgi:hypothetical protein
MRKKYDARFMKRASYIMYSISAQQQQLTSGNPNQKPVVDQIGQLKYMNKQSEQEILDDLLTIMKKLGLWVSTEDLRVLI